MKLFTRKCICNGRRAAESLLWLLAEGPCTEGWPLSIGPSERGQLACVPASSAIQIWLQAGPLATAFKVGGDQKRARVAASTAAEAAS